MVSIRRATSSDTTTIADIWNESLRTEPMAQWPLDCGHRDQATAVEFSVLARGYVDLESVWVDSDLRGAAAWLSPKAADVFGTVDDLVHAAVIPLTNDAGARYRGFWTWIAESMPTEPMWFLDIVAVRAEARGFGIGSALVRHGLELAERDKVPAILETGTQDNVAYYETFGFEVIHKAQAPNGGPTVWFMRTNP